MTTSTAVSSYANPVPIVVGFDLYFFWLGGDASVVYTTFSAQDSSADGVLPVLLNNGSAILPLKNGTATNNFIYSLASQGVPPPMPGPDPNADTTEDDYDDYGDTDYADDDSDLRLLQQAPLANLTQPIPPTPVYSPPASSTFTLNVDYVCFSLAAVVIVAILKNYTIKFSATWTTFRLALIPPPAGQANMQRILP